MNDPACSIRRVDLLRRVLIAEPKRNPASIIKLRLEQKSNRFLQGRIDPLLQWQFARRKPASPRPDRVRSQIGTASVKR